MKPWQLAVSVGVLALSCHWSITESTHLSMGEENKRLIAENERLRSFNTRRSRRLKWMLKPEKINLEAVTVSNHLLGIPPSVIGALIYCENGPQDLETGSIDKTDYFAMHFPIQQWSVLDGSRTLNRMLWEWLLAQDKETQNRFWRSASKPYTALSVKEQKTWANNMEVAEKRFRAEISAEIEKPLVSKLRTPIPDKTRQ